MMSRRFVLLTLLLASVCVLLIDLNGVPAAQAANPPSIGIGPNVQNIPANGTATIAIGIQNSDVTAATNVVATVSTGNLVVATPNGLAGTCPGSVVSAVPGSTLITVTIASMPGNSLCTVKFNLAPTGIYGYTSVIAHLTSDQGTWPIDPSALVFVAFPPTLTKTFGAATIGLNGTTSLTFDVTLPLVGTRTGVGFTDNLPPGLVIASPNGLVGPTDCGSGVVSAPAGGATITLSNAVANPQPSNCRVSVNVTGTTAGVKNNVTTNVTSNEGGPGNQAMASLTVLSPLTFTKAFGAASINVGSSTTLSFVVTNTNASTLTGVNFSDSLPAGLVVSTPNGLTGDASCGSPGHVTAVAGSSTITVAAVTLAPAATCSFSVNVTGTTPGIKNNLTSSLTSIEGGSQPGAAASLTVNTTGAMPPAISKSFSGPKSAPAVISVGQTAQLSFRLTNPNPSSLTGVAFTDTLPAGLVVSTPNNLMGGCGGGVISAAAGGTSIALSGASLGPGGSCSFSVGVVATTAGMKNNVTGNVSANESGPGGVATASITVAGGSVAPVLSPALGKAFGVSSIAVGGTTSLSFTITNRNAATSLTGLSFSDTLPAGLVVATPNGLTSSCGGSVSATAGSGSISLTGATLAPGATCAVTVNVTGVTAGAKANATSAVTSNEALPGAGAQAVLTVGPVGPKGVLQVVLDRICLGASACVPIGRSSV